MRLQRQRVVAAFLVKGLIPCRDNASFRQAVHTLAALTTVLGSDVLPVETTTVPLPLEVNQRLARLTGIDRVHCISQLPCFVLFAVVAFPQGFCTAC